MEKLKKLKIEYLLLRDEYIENYPLGNDGSISCCILLDRLREIECTFRNLDVKISDVEV